MTSRSLSRILTGLLLFPLACSSSGSSGSGTGGSNGSGSGGNSSTGSGGSNSSGSGGSTSTGSGGSTSTGSGGSNATGSGGSVVSGSGGRATGSGGSAGRSGSGGSSAGGTTGASGGTTGSGGSGNSSGSADQSVLERNKNPSRDGLFIQPTLTKAMAMAMAVDTNFNTAATLTSSTSANVAASPTYLDGPNGTGLFFIPTVGGDVIARKEDGSRAWSTSIGAPATGMIGCTSFAATTPPLGILSTPAIDAQSKTIYVAGILGSAQGVTSQVASAIDITTGKVKSGWPVDVGMLASFDPKIHNQRSALSLVNGTLFIPYAGYVGDCGMYHGRVVAINTATQALAGQWATGDNGGGIWASGGLASDGTSVFASTGNYVPLQTAPATHTDSEEVVRISATGTKADYFYPADDWSAFDKADGDLGSTNPILINVPGATPSKLIAAIAKGGHGYLLDAGSLHGTTTTGGGEKATFALSTQLSVYGSPASYKTAMGTYIVVTSSKNTSGCPGNVGTTGQVMAIRITPSPLAASVVWCASNASSTNPIATTTDGTSDAIVWYMNNGKLMGVDGDTGATVYTSSNTCSNVPKWSAPIAVKGRIIAAGNGHLCAWGIPGALSQAPQPAKAKRHKRTIASASHPRA